MIKKKKNPESLWWDSNQVIRLTNGVRKVEVTVPDTLYLCSYFISLFPFVMTVIVIVKSRPLCTLDKPVVNLVETDTVNNWHDLLTSIFRRFSPGAYYRTNILWWTKLTLFILHSQPPCKQKELITQLRLLMGEEEGGSNHEYIKCARSSDG